MAEQGEQARCLVEVDGEPVGVLLDIGTTVVFTATRSESMPCNGMRFATMLEGHRYVTEQMRSV